MTTLNIFAEHKLVNVVYYSWVTSSSFYLFNYLNASSLFFIGVLTTQMSRINWIGKPVHIADISATLIDKVTPGNTLIGKFNYLYDAFSKIDTNPMCRVHAWTSILQSDTQVIHLK